MLLVLIFLVSLTSATLVNKTILEWSRQINTCDSVGDLPISSGTTKLVYSHNDQQTSLTAASDTSPMYHGPSNRGTVDVNFFDASTSGDQVTDPQAYNITVFTDTYQIPLVSTYYHCQPFRLNFGPKKLHMIEVIPQIEAAHSGLVHHILLQSCPVPLSDSDLTYKGACGNGPANVSACVFLMSVWAVGGGPTYWPAIAGTPVQGEMDVVIEIHYNNPSLLSFSDSAGWSIFVTPNLRQYDSVTLALQRPTDTILIPPNTPNFPVEAYGDSQIFEVSVFAGGFPTGGVYFWGSMLHSHLLGRQIRVEQWRNGVYIGDVDYNPTYDFNFQQQRIFPKLVQMLATDTLKLTCTYDSTGIFTNTTGGPATTNEMCIAYLSYYPATANPLMIIESAPDPTDSNHTEQGHLQNGAGRTFSTKPFASAPITAPPCISTHHENYTIGTAGATYLPISSFNPNLYSNSIFMDSEGVYKLYWNISMFDDDSGNGIISFAAEVETEGWVGFGISPDGNMVGSDVVIGWVDSTAGTVSLLDRMAVAEAQPPIDQYPTSTQDIFSIRGYKGLYPRTIAPPNPIYYDEDVLTPPNPTPSTGSSNPTPSTGSTNPTPSTGSTNPTPSTGSPNPTPSTGSPNPTPSTGSPNPTSPSTPNGLKSSASSSLVSAVAVLFTLVWTCLC